MTLMGGALNKKTVITLKKNDPGVKILSIHKVEMISHRGSINVAGKKREII
ncbi:hypothetical protein [Lonsdalea quercina]|uniref:hypothetical protein n=1 Tax=Lonsdalea quercina TaxID=71657 RepID=UPI0039765BA2